MSSQTTRAAFIQQKLQNLKTYLSSQIKPAEFAKFCDDYHLTNLNLSDSNVWMSFFAYHSANLKGLTTRELQVSYLAKFPQLDSVPREVVDRICLYISCINDAMNN